MKAIGNATYLFREPDPYHRCSESFWTSLFALSVLTQSAAASPLRIPAFQCVFEGKHGHFEPDGHLIIPRALRRSEMVVEGKLRPGFLPKALTVPPGLLDLSPDIIINIDNAITLVEVKTVGHELGVYQKECYDNLTMFLKDLGYSVEMYYLLSAGHEKDRDFSILRKVPEPKQPFKLLLWEKVLQFLDCQVPRSSIIESLGDLSPYFANESGYMQW